MKKLIFLLFIIPSLCYGKQGILQRGVPVGILTPYVATTYNLVTRGLVSRYTYDAQSLVDDYASNDSSVEVGAVSYAAGGVGAKQYAVVLDGSTTIGFNTAWFADGDEFSWELWFKDYAAGANYPYYNLGLSFENGAVAPYAYYYTAGEVNLDPTPFNDGSWHQYVFTYNGSNSAGTRAKVYIDGALEAQDSVSNFAASLAKDVANHNRIGAGYNKAGKATMKCDDVKYYDVELTATEVLENYNYLKP